MSDYKNTPENREVITAVEQGQLGVVQLRRQTVIEATFGVMLHERSYHDKVIPGPVGALVEAVQGVNELQPYTPEVQPLQPQIQDTSVDISGRGNHAEREALLKIEAIHNEIEATSHELAA